MNVKHVNVLGNFENNSMRKAEQIKYLSIESMLELIKS